MKYFIDTEFIEGFDKPMFGKRRHFIDLISIGIVAEDGREYYAISNEFDVEQVWNRWDKKKCCNFPEICTVRIQGECRGYQKEYWLRENILKGLHTEMSKNESTYAKTHHYKLFESFSLKSTKTLIRWHGKPKNKIMQEVFQFVCSYQNASEYSGMGSIDEGAEYYLEANVPEFYGYYADYDWVLFCSLFGRMIDLPKGFPMYCRDLKQMLDEAYIHQIDKYPNETRLESWLKFVKNHPNYPKQENEHNALSDARWNKKLYDFITQKQFITDPDQIKPSLTMKKQ